jgi:hypothetical protein
MVMISSTVPLPTTRSTSILNEDRYEDWIQSEKDSISKVTHKIIELSHSIAALSQHILKLKYSRVLFYDRVTFLNMSLYIESP